MEPTVIYVNAGERSVRGVNRICVLQMVMRGGKLHKVELTEEIPKEGSLIVPVTYRVFRDMMKRHQLNFRKKLYETDEERREAKKRSLEKYRKSQKFRVKQLSRTKRHRTPGVLSADDVLAIKASKRTAIATSRWYGISLRQVQEVLDGKWDEGGVLVGSQTVAPRQD